MNGWKPWHLLPSLLLTSSLLACAPPPVPVFKTGQPALTVNWPLDVKLEGASREVVEERERAGALQEELLLQLRASGLFARIEARTAGQNSQPSAATASTEVVLDTVLEQLDLRYEPGSYPRYPYYGFSPHYPLGYGHFGYPWHGPWYGSYDQHLCAVAEVRVVLRDVRTGEVFLEKAYWDKSCRYDRDSRVSRERLYGTLGRESLIGVVDQITKAVEKFFY